MAEFIFKIDDVLYDEKTGQGVMKPEYIGKLTRCKDCKHWARNDGMFKNIDGRQWHHCPHLGIDTDGYFSCIEGKGKEE